MMASLCEFCCRVRVVVSGKGSRFLLCEKSASDTHFPKYPPQPVIRCVGFEPLENSPQAGQDTVEENEHAQKASAKHFPL